MADALSIVGEILGEPARVMRNPVNAGYQCPFINSTCIKRSQRTEGPYPVCSIYGGHKNPRLICVCPKRFYQVDLIKDILENCWPGEPPKNPRVAHEVQMKGFGTVDFVVADIDPETNHVRNFVSAELQAVDITGSVETAYTAVLHSQILGVRPKYGINWANVRKRYISQLIAKGFFHHHWKTRMVAILQTPLYERFRKYIEFDEMPVTDKSNVVFMLYGFQRDLESEHGGHRLVLERTIGTSHSSLMTGSLYREPPPRQVFCQKIIANLR